MRVRRAINQSIMLLLVLVIASSLTACQFLKLGKATPAKPNGTKAASPSSSTNALVGEWQVSYAVGGETLSAHMTLTTNQVGFEGTGTDDSTGQNFVIDSGMMSGYAVGFHKRYHVDENPNLPPIVYNGTFEMVTNPTYKGPYMHGSYKLDKGDGQPPVQGDWDAQKVENQNQGGQAAAQPQEQQPVEVDPSKPPDLSGKWNAGYEYLFKTFHSRMFVEQDGQKLTGHGADQNTNETFAITGTYNFPDIKIIHHYPILKLAKGKTKPARTLEFRGKVEVVNEAEYKGPRMTGKNIGGGDWMAEEIR